MKKYRTSYQPKHDQNTFIQVVKTTGMFQPGEVYTFVEFPDNHFIRQALCVSVRTLKREELTEEVSFLDANCDLDIYQEILDNRGMSIEQLLTVATFTNVHSSRKHNNVFLTEGERKVKVKKEKKEQLLLNPGQNELF